MMFAHVISKWCVSGFVFGVAQMFIESKSYQSLCFADIVDVLGLAQHALDLVHHVFCGASAFHPRLAGMTGLVS